MSLRSAASCQPTRPGQATCELSERKHDIYSNAIETVEDSCISFIALSVMYAVIVSHPISKLGSEALEINDFVFRKAVSTKLLLPVKLRRGSWFRRNELFQNIPGM